MKQQIIIIIHIYLLFWSFIEYWNLVPLYIFNTFIARLYIKCYNEWPFSLLWWKSKKNDKSFKNKNLELNAEFVDGLKSFQLKKSIQIFNKKIKNKHKKYLKKKHYLFLNLDFHGWGESADWHVKDSLWDVVRLLFSVINAIKVFGFFN